MTIKGHMRWHVHHDILAELCWSVRERNKYIRTEKDPAEVPTRLRLHKRVKGELPKEYVDACRKWKDAWRKWDEARRKWKDAWRKWDEARRKRDEARRKHLPAIMKLHKKECGCGWTKERGIDFGGEG